MTTVVQIVDNQIVVVVGGGDSIGLIAAAGTTQIAAVGAAGTTQIGLVNAAGTTAIADAEAASAALFYADTAAGLAAVAEGGFFKVIVDGRINTYQDIAGVATLRASQPKTADIDGLADKIATLETIGRPVASPPAAGIALDAGTYILGNAVVNEGTLETVRLWGAGTQTVKLRVFSKSGDIFTQVGSDTNLAVTAGLKTFTVSVTVAAGQYIGFYTPTGAMHRTVTTADGVGWYNSAGDVTTFTDAALSTTARLEIGADVSYQYVTAAREISQDGEIDTLQTESIDYERRITVAEDANVVQIIGKQSAPVTGSTSSAGTYVFADSAIGDGRITQIQVFSGTVPGTAQIKIFSTADGVHTQVGADIPWVLTASSLNTYTGSIPIAKGQRVGIYVSGTASILRAVAAAFSGGSDYLGGTNLTTGVAAAAPNVSSQYQIAYTLEVNRPDQHALTVRNSDRILLLGDSFTEGPYVHRGKNWPAKVSLFNDWTFNNFSKSGDKASDNLVRLRANTATLGVLPYRDRHATYALIYVGQNDFAQGVTLTAFLEDMTQLIETVKGLGATPILVAPHSLDAAIYGQGFSLIYRNLAEEHGCLFVDVAEWARVNDFGTRYNGFWNGTHPGVRTNQLQVAPVERLLNDLDAPRQSIKLFRKRSGVTVTTVADLIFNDHYQRARLFKEILIGTGALKVASEGLYDAADTILAADTELLSCEYEALQNGDSIAVDDYTLLEVVLPTTAKHIDYLTLTLNETGATVYARNILGTLTDGLALGSWVALNGGSGVYRLSRSELKRFIRQDKLSLLIYKSGGIAALTEPRIDWIGEVIQKPRKAGKTQGRVALGAEKLTNPDLGVATNWTATGTVSHGVPTDACLPYGSTGRATVDNTNYVSQAVTYTADNEKSREIEIRVNARRFPGIADGTITQESFDWAQLQIEVGTSAGRVPYREKVGLWWGDIVLRTIAPLGTTGLTLYIRGASGSAAIEVAKASVKFVDA